MFQTCRGNQHFFFANRAVYEITWENIVEPDRPRMSSWLLRIACWVPKATHAPSKCSTYFISTVTVVTIRLIGVALYVHCLSFIVYFSVTEKSMCVGGSSLAPFSEGKEAPGGENRSD
jgi:hypothetical protein